MTQTESEFLKNYDPSKYERPSVTADIIVLTLDAKDKLSVLLIQRKDHPHKDKWAIPGGFLQAGRESLEQTAKRELFEETKVADMTLTQLATFSDPGRDPRTHVISVAYTALVPKDSIQFQAGDDAKEAELFTIDYDVNGMVLKSKDRTIQEADLAFDHAKILRTAILRLRNRIDYEPDAFRLLQDPSDFTILELKRIYDTIKHTNLDNANFRKMLKRNYIDKGTVTKNDREKQYSGHRKAASYQFHE